ncbi:MAG: SRPBCC family protein [Candidatus Limnocylindria bacterium]
MAEFEFERTIRRPVDDVFAFLTDFRNGREWQSGIVSLEVLPDGPAQRGTLVMERRRIHGHDVELNYKVVELDRARRVAVEGTDGPVEYSGVHEFSETADGGTRLRFRVSVELTGGMRLLAGLITPAIRRQAEADLDRLTELLEARG